MCKSENQKPAFKNAKKIEEEAPKPLENFSKPVVFVILEKIVMELLFQQQLIFKKKHRRVLLLKENEGWMKRHIAPMQEARDERNVRRVFEAMKLHHKRNSKINAAVDAPS